MTPLCASLVTVLLSLMAFAHATTIDVDNNCSYPVWAAADPGGGQRLNQKGTWRLEPGDGVTMARIWGRTGCSFDGDGNGRCDTGDCGRLVCPKGNWGTNPKTVLEYTLAQPDNPTDTLDISLIEGFNIPMSFTPTSGVGSLDGKCRIIRCTADINGQCPQRWKVTSGCNSPCTTANLGSCDSDADSSFFKKRCPDAYSYPKDDQSSTWSCPPGTNYKLTFCP